MRSLARREAKRKRWQAQDAGDIDVKREPVAHYKQLIDAAMNSHSVVKRTAQRELCCAGTPHKPIILSRLHPSHTEHPPIRIPVDTNCASPSFNDWPLVTVVCKGAKLCGFFRALTREDEC